MAVTLAGVIAAHLQSNDRDVPLTELWTTVVAAGLNRTIEQVYAGVQSMASTGKCGRGQTSRTYCRLENAQAPVAKPVREPSAPGRHRRASSVGPVYKSSDVLAGIEAILGPAGTRPDKEKMYTFLLLGDADHEYVLERAEMVLKTRPTFWCHWLIGPNVCVGFRYVN